MLFQLRITLVLVAAMLLPGCPIDCEEGWAPLFEDLEAPVLSVTGRSADDVWMVGGGLGVDGIEALAMHYDGASWTTERTGRSETLWWAWTDQGSDQVWMVGEAGLVMRWSGGSFETIESGTDATLYGVWGSGPDDVWMVGGSVGAAGPKDVILHWDGSALTADSARPAGDVVLFKVWGSSAADLWIAGERGTMLHYDGAAWTDQSAQIAVTDSLLTVHGCGPNDIYAVGGRAIVHNDGSGWSAVDDLAPGSLVNGVHCAADTVLIVGNAGGKYRLDRATGSWVDEQFDQPWQTDFHGAWIAPEGQRYAVGGNFLTPPAAATRVGVVGQAGCPRP